MNRVLRILAVLVVAISIANGAYAAEPLPGDSCMAGEEDNFLRSGGKEIPTGHFIVCKSGTWRSILSWDAAAAVTKIGNLSCTNGQILKFNGTTWGCAADSGGTLPTLNSAYIWVGNGSSAATAVAISGDATLSNAGVLTIGSNAIGSAEITNASIALADLSATGTASATTYLRGDNTWATISSGLPALASASIWVGNGSNAAIAVAISGDATMTNAGVLNLGAGVVTTTEILDSTVASADIAADTIAAVDIATGGVATAEILDATILTADLADDAVTLPKLAATGTASATTYLRGDNTWATVPSSADNLGNHTATANLNMQDKWITMSNSGTNRLSFEAQSGFYRTAFDRLTFYDHGGGGDIAELNSAIGSTGVGGLALKAATGWNALMMDGSSSTKSLVMHYGGDADNQLRFGKYADNLGGWEANVALLDIDNGDLWTAGSVSANGNLSAGGALSVQGAITDPSVGTLRDADGGWVRTYGNTGWHNNTYGGGWYMQDTTWLRSYANKPVYTADAMRADGGIRTPQVCDVNGANCQAQSSLGIPAGAVMPFNLSACPSGWTPLAGAAGRVIVGVGNNGIGSNYTLGNAGGADYPVITAAQMPSHTHWIDPPGVSTNSTGAHNHTLDTQMSVTDGTFGSDNPRAGHTDSGRYEVTLWGGTNTAGAHTHWVDIGGFNSGGAGSGSAFDNRSAYYALLYCQKL